MLLLARLARRLTGRLRGLEPLVTGLRRTSGGTRVLGAVFVVLVVAATALLVASGSEADRVVSAAGATTEAGSARVAVTTVVDGGVGRSKQRIDASGVVDFGSGRQQYDVRVGAPRADVAATPGGVQLLVVQDGTDQYSRPARWPRDRAWIRDGAPEDRLNLEGTLLGDELRALRPGMRDLRDLGTEEVRGVETTRLSMEVDLLTAAAVAGDGARAEGLRQLADGVAEGKLTVEVWLAERVHRLRYEMSVLDADAGHGDQEGSSEPTAEGAAGPGVGPAASVTIVVEFYDFGVPVDIAVPSNVVSPELAGAPAPEPSVEPSDAPEAEPSPAPSSASSAGPAATEPPTSSSGAAD